MTVFADYADYYDLLYRDKDYEEESQYIVALLKKYAPHAQSLLEFGCGTAAYTECFLRSGFSVDGPDISPEMIRIATARIGALPEEIRSLSKLMEGDARDLDLGKSYDAVVSLFHVLSYQQTNADVLAFIQSAGRHLDNGGLAIFDFWYGPAVLCEQPSVRVKRCAEGPLCLTRVAEPSMLTLENLVEVNYELIAENSQSGEINRLKEKHVMRYFFLPELGFFLNAAGLTVLEAYQWMAFSKPDEQSWNVCVVARK